MRNMALRSRLVIFGDVLDFEAIGKITLVEPTHVRRRWEPPVTARATDKWSYELRGVYQFPENEDIRREQLPYPYIMTQFGEIERLFAPTADALGAWCAEHGATVMLAAGIHCETDKLPMLGLSASFIRFAAKLGAFTDYDIYTNVDVRDQPPTASSPNGDKTTAQGQVADNPPQDQIETGL